MKIKTQDQIISSLASSSSTSSLQSPRLRIRSIWIIFSSLLLVLLYFLSSDLDNHPLRPHSLLSFFNSIQFHPFFDSYLSDLHSHSPAFALRDESDHDWDQYVWHHQLHWNSTQGRLIVIGDVHGMVHALKKLLHHLNYNSSTDTVLLLGDVAAKHPSISASLHTIRFARTSGFLAIRGNHDQDIIAWRNWMEAHRKPSKTSDEADEERSLESVPEYEAETPPKELKHKLPKGWKWKSQHFEIARRLPQKDFRWLLSLSLTYHSETLHTYFVHAGMLPWDQTSGVRGRFLTSTEIPPPTDNILGIQENRDPLTLLEMRGVKHGRKPTSSGKKGTPWFKIWNEAMNTCGHLVGDESQEEVGADGKCGRPLNVIYGHWAAKGLTLKPWSTGLDTGCVYGRALSALVVGAVEDHPKLDLKPIELQAHQATVVSMSCKKP